MACGLSSALHNLDKALTFLRVCGLSHVVRMSGAFPQYYAHGSHFSQQCAECHGPTPLATVLAWKMKGGAIAKEDRPPPVAGKQRQILSHDLQDNLSPARTLILDK